MAKLTEVEAHDLLIAAHTRGLEAGGACTPTPMTLAGYAPIMDGVCGFAWVTILGNTTLGRLISQQISAMNKSLGHSQHHAWNGFSKNPVSKGFGLWVVYFGQSYERKRAYAQAFADHLTLAGHPATNGSRID